MRFLRIVVVRAKTIGEGIGRCQAATWQEFDVGHATATLFLDFHVVAPQGKHAQLPERGAKCWRHTPASMTSIEDESGSRLELLDAIEFILQLAFGRFELGNE